MVARRPGARRRMRGRGGASECPHAVRGAALSRNAAGLGHPAAHSRGGGARGAPRRRQRRRPFLRGHEQVLHAPGQVARALCRGQLSRAVLPHMHARWMRRTFRALDMQKGERALSRSNRTWFSALSVYTFYRESGPDQDQREREREGYQIRV